MHPLPFLHDDILAEIAIWLSPPLPAAMTSDRPSLLVDILERWRPVPRDKDSLVSFSKVSKRFKIIADPLLYALVVLKHSKVIEFGKQLKLWLSSASHIPSLINGLAFLDGSTTYETIDGVRSHIFILSSLPKLLHLDLGGECDSEVLLELFLRPHPLRSIIGVGLTTQNYYPACRLIHTLRPTLLNLGVSFVSSLKPVSEHDLLSVTLPHLRRLSIEPFSEDDPSQPLAEGQWDTPKLEVVEVGLASNGMLGEKGLVADLLECLGSAVRAMTLPMWEVGRPSRPLSLLAESPGIKTFAIHITNENLWTLGEEDDAPGPVVSSVQSIIIVQESENEMLRADIEARVHTALGRVLARTTLPNLQRVFYIPEAPGGPIWNVWARLSLDLVRNGIEIVYL